MKKVFIRTLMLMALLGVFSNKAISQKAKAGKDDDNDWNFGDNRTPGTWDAIIKGDQINIQFNGKHWSEGRNFQLAAFGILPMDKIGEFSLTRESGKVSFRGVFQNHWGHGTYQFDESAAFKSYMAQKSYTGLDNQLMLSIFFTDINKGYFDFMKENGYPNITNNELKDLAEQDLSRKTLDEYFNLFKTEGYGRQSIDKIVELREHGVNASFVKSFHQAGYKDVPLDKALELRDHGVNPAYIASMQQIGHKEITLDQAISLRDHGVSPEYIKSIQQMGYKDITLDKAQDLKDHGVNPEFIRSMQELGYNNITLDKAQELQDHGVNPGFIKSINALGFKDLSLDKAQELKDRGVSAAFIQKMKDKGINVHTLDDYIKLKDTGFEE